MNNGNGDDKPKINPDWMGHLEKGAKLGKSKQKKEKACDNYKGYIAVDFDGTLATYHRPWVYNALGEPNKVVVEAVNYFYNEGYHINVFTGRLRTPELAGWLKKHKVQYHSINANPKDHSLASLFKPYWNCYIGDKAIRYNKNESKTTKGFIEEIKKVLKWSKE
jgi:hypothetical protein